MSSEYWEQVISEENEASKGIYLEELAEIERALAPREWVAGVAAESPERPPSEGRGGEAAAVPGITATDTRQFIPWEESGGVDLLEASCFGYYTSDDFDVSKTFDDCYPPIGGELQGEGSSPVSITCV